MLANFFSEEVLELDGSQSSDNNNNNNINQISNGENWTLCWLEKEERKKLAHLNPANDEGSELVPSESKRKVYANLIISIFQRSIENG